MELKSVPACPTCGAAAKDLELGAQYTCPFCGGVSSVVAPAPVVQQILVQPEVIQRVVMVDPATDRTSLPCPRCRIPLFEGKTDTVTLHGCGRCGGVWLDNAGSSTVVHAGNSALLAITDKAAKVRKAPVDETKIARCPLDGDELAKTIVRGVHLDVCATHGTWFDAGEVRRLASIFHGERIASAGGPTYDYASAAKDSVDASAFAKAAIGILGAVLSVAAATERT